MDNKISLQYDIDGSDFTMAGEASSSLKKVLKQLGVAPETIRRAAISMYEAEINAVIHAGGGVARIEISPDKIYISVKDNGPGIEEVEKAMQEGFSTAPESIREMGFGAGMGLPNIKRYSDDVKITTKVHSGTTVEMTINIKQ